MKRVKGFYVRRGERERECGLGANHKFPMQCVDDVLRDLKTLSHTQCVEI